MNIWKIYLANKHFQYLVEGWQLFALTDQELLTSALSSHSHQHSHNRLATYTCLCLTVCCQNTRYVEGASNAVADSLSWVGANALNLSSTGHDHSITKGSRAPSSLVLIQPQNWITSIVVHHNCVWYINECLILFFRLVFGVEFLTPWTYCHILGYQLHSTLCGQASTQMQKIDSIFSTMSAIKCTGTYSHSALHLCNTWCSIWQGTCWYCRSSPSMCWIDQ